MPSLLTGLARGGRRFVDVVSLRPGHAPDYGIIRVLDNAARSFGGILMVGTPVGGLFILAALAVEPNHIVGGLIGFLVAAVVLNAIGNDDAAQADTVSANTILAAVAASWLIGSTHQPFYAAILFIIVASGATALTSAALTRAFANGPIPALSISFAITFGALLTLLPNQAIQAAASEPLWPYPISVFGWIDSFLRSMGMILLSPRPETGVLVLAAVFVWSRVMVLSGVIGWIAGVLTAHVLGSFGFHWLWLFAAHNSFIAAMLLGALFYLPSRLSLVISVLAGAGAAMLALVLQMAIANPSWAFQPLPSIFTVWIALLALSGRPLHHPIVSTLRRDLPPEEAWYHATMREARFGAAEPLVAVPVAGVVTISQSFDGPLSHRGLWRHGIDFDVLTDSGVAGGIFGASVYCPADGVVERVCAGVPDNPPGVSNFSQNWGNHVIIRMDQGSWLMLAHLGRDSITVQPGQRVVVGQALAAVGNSGRSPSPHLHLQVQSGPSAGAPTVPFKLANYVEGTTAAMTAQTWIRAGVPESGTFVRAALQVPATFRIAATLATGAGLWRLTKSGEIPARFAGFPHTECLSTALDAAGNHCVSDDHGGRLIMRAEADALRGYEMGGQPGFLLRLWSMALPVLPYCAVPGLTWSDRIAPPALTIRDRIETFAAPYFSPALPVARLMCTAIPNEISREIVVETQFLGHRAHFPARVTARIAPVSGPVAWQAQFEKGSISAEMVSFGPLFPKGY